MIPKCKMCKQEIPLSRINARNEAKFCSKECTTNYHNRLKKKEREKRPILKCEYCRTPTNRIKHWCSQKCYQLAALMFDSKAISHADYDALNKSFVGTEESECVVL